MMINKPIMKKIFKNLNEALQDQQVRDRIFPGTNTDYASHCLPASFAEKCEVTFTSSGNSEELHFNINQDTINAYLSKTEDKPEKNGWISVKDSLPEVEGRYLCFLDKQIYLEAHRAKYPDSTCFTGDPPFYEDVEIFKWRIAATLSWREPIPHWDAKGWAGDLSKYITHWCCIPLNPKTT